MLRKAIYKREQAVGFLFLLFRILQKNTLSLQKKPHTTYCANYSIVILRLILLKSMCLTIIRTNKHLISTTKKCLKLHLEEK